MALVSKATPPIEKKQSIEEFVVQSLGRDVFERIVVRPLYGDRYRVNWSNEITGRIVRSQFLVITKTRDGFVIRN